MVDKAQAAAPKLAAVPADELPDVDQPKNLTFKLRRAVMGPDGNQAKELTLREPSGADIEIIGNPVNLDFSQDHPMMTFDARKMTAMLAALANVTPTSIRKLHPKDWNTMAWSVGGFFIPDLDAI